MPNWHFHFSDAPGIPSCGRGYPDLSILMSRALSIARCRVYVPAGDDGPKALHST